eukprot:jgi/Tetstr1/429528/TSEL_019433.t1
MLLSAPSGFGARALPEPSASLRYRPSRNRGRCAVAARSAAEGLSAIIVGGSSGMGKGAAKEVVRRGGRVLIASRSLTKLERAAEEISLEAQGGGAVSFAALDNTDEAQVREFFANLDKPYDALVVSAADKALHGPFLELPPEDVQRFFLSKYWGAYYCAHYGGKVLQDDGSITFFSGVLNRRPGLNCSPLAAINGAVEGLTRSLALELGPKLRVNCFSPGFMNTERFDHMDEEKREAMLANTASSLPLGRVGTPDDAGEALYFLMTNKFTTGIVLDCDGGHQIRQYAQATSDPFRASKQ